MAALPNTSKLPPLPPVPAATRPEGSLWSPLVLAWNRQKSEFDRVWNGLTQAQRDEWIKTLGVTLPPAAPPPSLMKNGKFNPSFQKNQGNWIKSMQDRSKIFEDALRAHQSRVAAAATAAGAPRPATPAAPAQAAVAQTPVVQVPVAPVAAGSGPTAAVAKAVNTTVKVAANVRPPMNTAQRARLGELAGVLTRVATNLGAMATAPAATAPAAKGGARRGKSRRATKKRRGMSRRK
jgi:hypothetical protein